MNERLDAFAMNAHLSPDTIAEYFSDTLSPDDQVLVEEHVAGCDVCALAAQGAFVAGTVVDQWTARAHGEASACRGGACVTVGDVLLEAHLGVE